ncbi:pentapeptide repeat-containing protein [Variovorax sp. J2P1-59]|uniref:pentapeptide repeat-containing protein n=1 Tax=Variovorax flavidus TaxID=3053501 RepID=UPI002577A0BB|nr:pentapeptide repeat-containing protein [Variovorax sp. J2P1-59]MDM0073975.1 pentapeptide repeat-containing protein [Variovorax sp. J2P1-59]
MQQVTFNSLGQWPSVSHYVENAETEPAARGAALAHCAAEGIELRGLSIDSIDFAGGNFDGLRLTGCAVRNADMREATFRGAIFTDCRLDGMRADDSTSLEGATLEGCQIDQSDISGLFAPLLAVRGCTLRGTEAIGLVVPESTWTNVKTMKSSNLSGWVCPMSDLRLLEGAAGVVEASEGSPEDREELRDCQRLGVAAVRALKDAAASPVIARDLGGYPIAKDPRTNAWNRIEAQDAKSNA